jgi:hypothetical protein
MIIHCYVLAELRMLPAPFDLVRVLIWATEIFLVMLQCGPFDHLGLLSPKV